MSNGSLLFTSALPNPVRKLKKLFFCRLQLVILVQVQEFNVLAGDTLTFFNLLNATHYQGGVRYTSSQRTPFNYTSPYQYLYIQFVTDSVNVGYGFAAQYSTVAGWLRTAPVCSLFSTPEQAE